MSSRHTAPLTSLRRRVSEVMLRTGTELAIDQREMEARMAAAHNGNTAFSSAHGAVALARWADSAVLWFA